MEEGPRRRSRREGDRMLDCWFDLFSVKAILDLSVCLFLSNLPLSPCSPPPSIPLQVRVPVAPDGSMLPSLPPTPPGMGLDDDAQGANDLIPRRM